jgi:hypothetical protein
MGQSDVETTPNTRYVMLRAGQCEVLPADPQNAPKPQLRQTKTRAKYFYARQNGASLLKQAVCVLTALVRDMPAAVLPAARRLPACPSVCYC